MRADDRIVELLLASPDFVTTEQIAERMGLTECYVARRCELLYHNLHRGGVGVFQRIIDYERSTVSYLHSDAPRRAERR